MKKLIPRYVPFGKSSQGIALLLVLCVLISSKCGNQSSAIISNVGAKAYQLTQEMVAFGPRPVGSEALAKVRDWIEKQVVAQNLKLERTEFRSATPLGDMPFVNVKTTILSPVKKHRVVLVAHYESKLFSQFKFVGANDAASSVALLLSLMPTLKEKNYPFNVELLFVDGEEALVDWSTLDSLYGSRFYVSDPSHLTDLTAAIVVDMVGDKNLKYVRSAHSDAKLLQDMAESLAEMGRADQLDAFVSPIEDDHIPFVQKGIPVLHLMDFTYPPWHTQEDTVEQLSKDSLGLTAAVIVSVLDKISLRLQ